MAAAAMKHMASSFTKLEKFEGVDFRRWQKKIHFMLFSMSVVYELTTPMPKDGGRKPALSFMKPFGCLVTILNTIDHLGKFDGKTNERFFVGYSTNSKAFRVFNSRTRIVEENLHVKFSENTPNIAGSRPNWLFYIDALTKSMNYKPVVAGNQSNGSVGTKACDNVGKTRVEIVAEKDYILLPLWTQDLPFSSSTKDSPSTGYKPSREEEKKDTKDPGNEDSEAPIIEEPRVNQENDNINSTNRVNAVSSTVNAASNEVNAVGGKSSIKLPDDPNMPELEDISIFEDSNEDVFGEKADLNNLESTFQVYRNKMDERGIVIKNKARLVAQGHTQKEGIVFDEDFAPVVKIEPIRMFLAYASFKDFVVYQMDVKSSFLYEKIKKEIGALDPKSIDGELYTNDDWNEVKELLRMELRLTLLMLLDINLQLLVMLNVVKVIFEASIRRDLRFGDEGGIDCLPNETIFEQLSLIGTIASAVICLDTNQKFNFSKYIFDSMVKHIDSGNKFFMYPSNMRWVGKDFSRRDTPLFPTILVQAQADMDEPLNEENVPTQSNDPHLLRVNTLRSKEDRLKLNELMKLYAKLSDRVLNLKTTKTAQAKEISRLKKRDKRLEKKKKSRTYELKRLYKVGLSTRVESFDEESLGEEDASK
nr:hypothetical protein [Tanacetum cinerariifolium]